MLTEARGTAHLSWLAYVTITSNTLSLNECAFSYSWCPHTPHVGQMSMFCSWQPLILASKKLEPWWMRWRSPVMPDGGESLDIWGADPVSTLVGDWMLRLDIGKYGSCYSDTGLVQAACLIRWEGGMWSGPQEKEVSHPDQNYSVFHPKNDSDISLARRKKWFFFLS